MKIGFIGAGQVAQTLARHMLAAGHEVLLSNHRGPESLKEVVSKLGPGAYAGTREEAAQQEIVVLAVWWDNAREALAGLPEWNGRILIDATNQLTLEGGKPHVADTTPLTGSEVIASYAPGAHVIKAFDALFAQYMDGESEHGRRVLFFAGDDVASKKKAASLFSDMKFFPVDLGGLRDGGKLMQVGGPLSATHFTQTQEGDISFFA